MATTGASLQPIYERLNGMQRHHPLDAETFADWSMEAGDTVKVTRGDDEYEAPVHTSTLVWKGGAPKITVNSTGNEKRDPLTKLERRNFGRGGGGVRVAKKQFTYEVNQEHLWYEVMDENGKVSRLEVDTEKLQHEVFDSTGKVSRLRNDVDGLHHDVYDDDGKVSQLENTAEGLYNEVYDPKTGMKTTLTTHAGAFSVLCTGITGSGKNAKLKVAAIQATIDSATGSSKIKLNADHVDISGDAVTLTGTSNIKLNNVLTITGNAAGFMKPVICQEGLTIANKGNNALNTYRVNLVGSETIELTPMTVGPVINSIRVTGPSSNVYTLQFKTMSNSSWQDAGTFSRAVTSMNGSWSSGKLTVTPQPQGTPLFERWLASGTASRSGDGISIPIRATWGSSQQYSEATGWSAYASISGLFDSLRMTNVKAGRTSGGYDVYYGKLYYWDDDVEEYVAASNGNQYWYYASSRLSGSTTFYY